MLDALGEELFAGVDPAAVMHASITQELDGRRRGGGAAHRAAVRAQGRDRVSKVGLELVIRAGGHKRTLSLPPALGDYRPTGAAFDDGALRVTFARETITADA